MALGVYAEKLAAERELFTRLDISELEELARESEALVAKAMAMVRANAVTAGAARPLARWSTVPSATASPPRSSRHRRRRGVTRHRWPALGRCCRSSLRQVLTAPDN